MEQLWKFPFLDLRDGQGSATKRQERGEKDIGIRGSGRERTVHPEEWTTEFKFRPLSVERNPLLLYILFLYIRVFLLRSRVTNPHLHFQYLQAVTGDAINGYSENGPSVSYLSQNPSPSACARRGAKLQSIVCKINYC
jgi:hypothetical protein